MTVTSDPAELRAKAVVYAALGMHAMAAHLLTEAIDNNIVAQRDSTATTAAATDTTNRNTEIATSRVLTNKGYDGTVVSG
jgi:hypothetical protein